MRFKITGRLNGWSHIWDDIEGETEEGLPMFDHEKATFRDMLANEDFCRYTLDKTFEIV